ncbi:MAG: redoxin domain-containing protein, partial [Pirellulaceae bacterium]
MKFRISLFAAMAAICIAPLAVSAQETEQESEILTIGSVAPQLDIEHWVQDGKGKFQPVTKFEEGNVYMVEFWATWCGPCIASMPHLAELQNEYADQGLRIISVSDEDLETVEEFLERDVRDEEDMTYDDLTSNWSLTTDPDDSVSEDYMRAAGQDGIPTAFVVGKTGHIEWIGHPMEIDEPLEQVMNDEWDRETFAVKFRSQQELQMLMGKLRRKMMEGDTDAVIEMLGEAIEKTEDSDTKQQLTVIRAQIVISSGAEGAAQAMNDLTEAISHNPEGLNNVAWAVVEKHQGGEEVDEELVAAAVAATEKALESSPDAGHIIDTLAHLVHMQGDLDRAIELTEKAVELSGDDFPG